MSVLSATEIGGREVRSLTARARGGAAGTRWRPDRQRRDLPAGCG